MIDRDYPFIRVVRSPLTEEMLAPLDPRCRVVQFSELLTEADLDKLAAFLEGYPDVPLRVYGGFDKSITDLEFLRHFPRLTRFAADSLPYQDFTSIEGLRFLPDNVVELALGLVKPRLSLGPLARFTSLRSLYLEGASWKDTDVITGCGLLEELTLHSTSLHDLSLVVPLRRLRSLALKLGGLRDLSLLPELASLVYLELWMIRGLEDISPVGALERLQFLFLQDLARITRLPPMSRMKSLRRVQIQNLKSLTDLSPLLDAPALEELILWNTRNFEPADFEAFVGHPTLKAASIGLGSMKKNDAVERLLRLPEPEPLDFEFH